MSYVPHPRGTLLVPSGPSGNHLFVIMTKVCPNNMHLLLSICTIRHGISYDDACVFEGGEHVFIKGPSYVLYRKPEQRAVASLKKCVATGFFRVKDDLREKPFRKMCGGVSASMFISPWAAKYFKENCP